jgi:hypothetical protein
VGSGRLFRPVPLAFVGRVINGLDFKVLVPTVRGFAVGVARLLLLCDPSVDERCPVALPIRWSEAIEIVPMIRMRITQTITATNMGTTLNNVAGSTTAVL